MPTPCSARFLQTLARPHTQLCYVDVLKSNAVVATFGFSDPTSDIWLLDGSVPVARNTIRRQATINLFDRAGTNMPRSPGDLLAPFETELRVWVGVRYWDSPLPSLSPGSAPVQLQADTEFVPVITGPITGISGDFPTIQLQLNDRAWYLSNFEAPYAIAAGTNCRSALSALLGAQIPAGVLVTNLADTELTTPALTYDADSSSTDAYNTLADTAGWMLYPDPMGVFVSVPEPATNDTPDRIYAPGAGTMLIGHPKPTLGAQDPVNAVVYTGEGGQATSSVRGYAEDDDPESFTYVGRIGVRPEFDSSPLITSTSMGNTASKTRLQKVLGVSNTITVTSLPDPTVEAGDVWHVQDPDQAMDEIALTDSFTVQIRAAAGNQDVVCRANVLR